MSTLNIARRLLLAGSALFLHFAAADAQVRYIASTGKDANNCASPATPCRTLSRGIGTTPANGELRILDSGAYGNGGLINKSMTISADGETLMLDAPLTIDAAGATVTLRGLSLNGRYAVLDGIYILNAAVVHVDNCRIEHLVHNGILSQSSNIRLFVNDTVSRQNIGRGLEMKGQSTRLTVDNSRFEGNNGSGIGVVDGLGSITRTITSGNLANGIWWNKGQLNVAWSASTDNNSDGYSVGMNARIDLESSVARGNGGGGLYASGAATISNFTATQNKVGIHIFYGTVYSRQNNTIAANTTNIVGSLAPLPPL